MRWANVLSLRGASGLLVTSIVNGIQCECWAKMPSAVASIVGEEPS